MFNVFVSTARILRLETRGWLIDSDDNLQEDPARAGDREDRPFNAKVMVTLDLSVLLLLTRQRENLYFSALDPARSAQDCCFNFRFLMLLPYSPKRRVD